jgi:hypothetical protein
MKKPMKEYLLVIMAIFMAISSCKKDDDSFHDYAPGLAGTWRFVHSADPKYLLINIDRTCSFLSTDVQGIRDKNDAILMVTGNQVLIDNGDPNIYPNISIYNYLMKGDSLILSNPQQTLTLVKDENSSISTSWFKQIVSERSYRAPVSELTDITFDGSLIWYGNGYNTNYLYNLNPANGTTDSLLVEQYAWSVEADSNNLWVSNDGSDKVLLIKKTDGSLITSTIEMGAWIYGLAKDNDFLWCYSNNEGTLYKYKITDNTVPLSTKIASNWDGMAMAKGFLYVAANGKLHKCTTAPLSCTASFELKGYYIFGVAYDGSSIWVSAYKFPNDWPEIIKLSNMD